MALRWPLRLAPVGPVAMGSSLWRLEGQLMATVVAKVTASFAVDATMSLVAPEPVRLDDEHDGGHPMRSLVGARELAPQLYEVDVLMVGHAYPGSGAAQTRVRLAMERSGTWVLNKMVTVYGDREGSGAPQPFEKIRLGWEKAYGGIGHADNPLGTGFGSSTTKPPNIVYSDGREQPASFGPIPQSFPNRKKLLGGVPRKQVTEGIAELPASFDWAYFQAAPADQRLAALHGDEWLHLEGVHPGMRRIRTRLPGAQLATKVYGHQAVGAPNVVPMRADMILIEPDELRVSLVYRGSFPVMRPEGLSQVIVAAGPETAEEPMLWPESTEDLEILPHEIPSVSVHPPQAEDAPPSAAAPRPFEGTFAMSPEEVAQSTGQPLPFARAAGAGTPPSSQRRDNQGLPFGRREAGPASPHPPDVVPPSNPLEGTVSISDDQPPPPSLPFQGEGASGGRPPSRPPAEIPGAPWAKSPAAPVMAPQPDALGTAAGAPRKARTVDVGLAGEQMQRQLQAKLREERPAAPRAEPSEVPPPIAPPVGEGDAERGRAQQAEQTRQAEERRQAEQTRQAEERRQADEERLLAEKRAEEERLAAAEAEARRREEAEKFRQEQAEAERDAKRKAEEEAREKREAAKKLRENIYGGFKRRG